MEERYKDPDARLDYVYDWEEWLNGDKLVSAFVVADPSGLTVEDDPEVTDDTVTVWLSDGQAGDRFNVTCSVVTQLGREDDRTFRLIIKQR